MKRQRFFENIASAAVSDVLFTIVIDPLLWWAGAWTFKELALMFMCTQVAFWQVYFVNREQYPI